MGWRDSQRDEEEAHDFSHESIRQFLGHETAERDEHSMSHVPTSDLIDELEGETHYLEVLSEDSLSVELARYPNPEPKTPHKTDELYYIIAGSGTAQVGDEQYSIAAGDVVYVERGVDHDFFDIDEEITALVVFTTTEESVLGRDL